jgi:hypothetical protein
MDWPSVEDSLNLVNKMIKDNSGTKYILIDSYTALAQENKLVISYDSGDGVHLSIDGYRVVGELLSETFISLISNE